jgi:hypothetical protein
MKLMCTLQAWNRSQKFLRLCPQQGSLLVGIGLLASRYLALKDLLAIKTSTCKQSYCPYFGCDQMNSWLSTLCLQSQADPSEIMMEVLKTLQELNIVWKVIGAYSVRCRWVPPPQNPSKSCNWSAGNSLSESPMTLGSFHSSEMSFQANGVMLDDNKLGDQFLVRFEIQVCRLRTCSLLTFCFTMYSLLIQSQVLIQKFISYRLLLMVTEQLRVLLLFILLVLLFILN